MPISFAFELTDEPTNYLIQIAWNVEPMITAILEREAWDYILPKVEGDKWTRGVLNNLLFRGVSEESREIALESRVPPKYPLPPYLVATLRGSSFWYAGQTHDAGIKKLNRLKKLLTSGRWIELLPIVLEGNEDVFKDLSPAVLFLIRTDHTITTSKVFSTATASELCLLRRRKKISHKEFLLHWARSLEKSNDSQLDNDLIDIISSEKENVNELISRMLKLYEPQLKNIAFEKKLSLRVLSILIRNKVVSPNFIRLNEGWLRSIINRMSLMNGIRLIKEKVIKREDLTKKDCDRLIMDLFFDNKTREEKRIVQLNEAINHGLFTREDIPRTFFIK